MTKFNYTTVDTVLAKIYRDIGEEFPEIDLIEWIGEAVSHMLIPSLQEQAVSFIEVKNFQADLPKYFNAVLQIAKDANNVSAYKIPTVAIIEKIISESSDCLESIVPCNNKGILMKEEEFIVHNSTFSVKWDYNAWTKSGYYKNRFEPVRLSSHMFFSEVVCKEKLNNVYNSCKHEYTIIGTSKRKLRFSFEQGIIALSYLKTAIDEDTGYPLIPDFIEVLNGITAYVKEKIASRYIFQGRDGYSNIQQTANRDWIKYLGQVLNKAMMPQTVDEMQSLLEQTHQLIPKRGRYYNYFGNLNT